MKILTSSETLVDPTTGETIKAPLVEEKSRAWRLDKEIENLELERIKAKTEYGDQGLIGSPGSGGGSPDRDGNWSLFLSKLPEEVRRCEYRGNSEERGAKRRDDVDARAWKYDVLLRLASLVSVAFSPLTLL